MIPATKESRTRAGRASSRRVRLPRRARAGGALIGSPCGVRGRRPRSECGASRTRPGSRPWPRGRVRWSPRRPPPLPQPVRDGLGALEDELPSGAAAPGAAELPKDLVGDRLDGLRPSGTGAVLARAEEVPAQILANTPASHLDQPELGDREYLGPSPIRGHGVHELVVETLAVLREVHVDEVDDDDAADVSDLELFHHRAGGLEVHLERGGLEVPGAHIPTAVDVYGGQRLGAVDDDVPTRRQRHATLQRGPEPLLHPGRENKGSVPS